jgi:uncharacterized protein
VSFLYRYIPRNRKQRPGALQKGGRLQVMTLEQGNFNADLADPGQKFGVVWRDVDPAEPHESAEDLGAARFNRLEGAHFAGGAFWFDDTNGGEKRLGQIFRYLPATNPSSSSTRAPSRARWRARTTSSSRPGETCGSPRTRP